MPLLSELNGLMLEYGFTPKKKLGQNFAVDESLIACLVKAAELKKADHVLEVGAGTGFLTRELQKHCSVTAVELDDTLFELLEKELGKKNLALIHGDFCKQKELDYNKVVCLPPYTISSKLMFSILRHGFDLAVIVFQREFAEKLLSVAGLVKYNALSVLTQYYCRTGVVERVPAKSFFPKPGSDSAVLKLVSEKRFGSVKHERLFEFFIKAVFRYKNKNLRNALRNSFEFVKPEFEALGIGKSVFEERVARLGMRDVKVNLVSVKEFVEIFNELTGTSRE